MPGPAARVGDQTVHGGVITGPGVPNVLIGGMPASVVGDMHVCPMATPGTPPIPHVGGPISSPGAPTVLIGGRPAATIGSMCVCVGPPDSVVMGAPTVMLGTAGSGAGSAGSAGGGGAGAANASAAAASFDNNESVTKEEHWIEFAFVDSAGNAVSGVPYRFKDPSGEELEGVLRLDGRVRRDALAKEGQGEVTLMSVYGAEWGKKEALVDENVKFTAKVDGFDDGTAALVQIRKRDLDGPDVVVTDIETEVRGGKVEGEWTYVYPEEPEDDEGAPRRYSAPQYFFEVIVGPRTARSGLLKYKDYVEIELRDEQDQPTAGAEYVLYVSDGSVRRGTLDGQGRATEEDLPPGYHEVRFPNVEQ